MWRFKVNSLCLDCIVSVILQALEQAHNKSCQCLSHKQATNGPEAQNFPQESVIVDCFKGLMDCCWSGVEWIMLGVSRVKATLDAHFFVHARLVKHLHVKFVNALFNVNF